MKLVFWRHGPAGDREAWAESGKPDAARPLTAKGRRKTARAAAGLKRVAGKADRLASSPLARARQTAEFAARELELEVENLEELAPNASPAALVKKLSSYPPRATLVVVGHEPGLGEAVQLLCGGRVELKKAGACLVSCRGIPRIGSGKLAWLLAPRQLRALGK